MASQSAGELERNWKVVNGNIITNNLSRSNTQAIVQCLAEAHGGSQLAKEAILESNWTWLHYNRAVTLKYLALDGDMTPFGIEKAKQGDALAQRALRMIAARKLTGK